MNNGALSLTGYAMNNNRYLTDKLEKHVPMPKLRMRKFAIIFLGCIIICLTVFNAFASTFYSIPLF